MVPVLGSCSGLLYRLSYSWKPVSLSMHETKDQILHRQEFPRKPCSLAVRNDVSKHENQATFDGSTSVLSRAGARKSSRNPGSLLFVHTDRGDYARMSYINTSKSFVLPPAPIGPAMSGLCQHLSTRLSTLHGPPSSR